jgi:hypothetical protein
MVHPYNPSYSGGRDQEDGGWKPAEGNSSPDSILKIPNTNKKKKGRGELVEWLKW